jgi:signal transduction histidine kinase
MSSEQLRVRLGAALFDAAPCQVAVVDQEYRVVLSNPAFEGTFGGERGPCCHHLCKGVATRCERCVAADAFADGREHSSVEQGITADNAPFVYNVQGIPVRDSAGALTHVLLIASDITRVSELEEALRQAEPLANVGLSTAGLAHTIKNILAGLEGGVYVVDSAIDKGDDARLRSGWRMVQDYVGQVASLVKNLLSYARPRKPGREDVDTAELVAEIVELYRAKANASGIEIDGHVEGNTPSLRADRQAMHAVLANLVTNAIDACTWDPDTDKQHAIVVEARPGADGGVRLEVRDNGMGISGEYQRKILVSCFTTKGMRGNGLGLLLSKQTVQDHGGTIDYVSRPGQGTTFTIDLPALPDGGQT